MLDWLYWYIILCYTKYPCDSIEYFNHNTNPRISHAPTNSILFKILVFNFFFLDRIITSPFPSDIMSPVFPLHYLRVLYVASTHHFTIYNDSTARLSFVCLVTFKYFNILSSFSQYYSSGLLTLVVRKATSSCISLLDTEQVNNMCANVQWNTTACSWGKNFTSH